jgi:hypothetical protein
MRLDHSHHLTGATLLLGCFTLFRIAKASEARIIINGHADSRILGKDRSRGFTDSEWVSGILGQSGFFANYRVTFERFRWRFEVTSRAKLRPRGT